MAEFRSSINKEEINQLPLASFGGVVVVVDTPERMEETFEVLNRQKVVGFDTETKPVFAKGKKNKVALLQISTRDVCYLIRLNMLGFTPQMINFFNNPDILKVGLSIKDDFLMLRARSADLNPQGFIELQSWVKSFGIEDNSLQKIFAIIFEKKISKSQRLSNWETETLTSGQQHYAALDAWACLCIYEELLRYSASEI